jgi:hypothetical protein
MAVSKPWSGGTEPATQQKYFTIAEANRALPLVQRVVGDIVRTHEEASALHSQLEHRMPVKQRDEIQNKLENAVDRLNDLVEELKTIGCELKDYRTGLIDFVGRHEGRDIYLCWRLGEAAVEHWHELHAGFAGRQPASMLED